MPNGKTDTQNYNEAAAGKQQDIPNDGTQIGRDIPYASNIPPTLISDDSKNTIAEQDHEGSDNSPNGSRGRDNS